MSANILVAALLLASASASYALFLTEEKALLLRFKEERSSASEAAIASWSNSTELCAWRGVTCDDGGGHVKELSLAYSGLTGTLPEGFGELTGLTTLMLHDNELTGTVPPSWSALTNLQFGLLDHNMLTGTFPKELSNLQALDKMDLRSNCLDTANLTEAAASAAMYIMPQMNCSAAKEHGPAPPCAAKDEEAASAVLEPSLDLSTEGAQDAQQSRAPEASTYPPAAITLDGESPSEAPPLGIEIPDSIAVFMICLLVAGGMVFVGCALVRWGYKFRKARYVVTLQPLAPKDPSATSFSSSSDDSSMREIPAKMTSARTAAFAWESADATLGLPKLGV